MKEYKNLEEFKDTLFMYLKQKHALADGRSYFDVETSNVDGTFIGEEADNGVRIGIMKQYYPEYMSQINFEELDSLALEQYKKDLQEYLDKYGDEE